MHTNYRMNFSKYIFDMISPFSLSDATNEKVTQFYDERNGDGKNDQLQFESNTVSSVILVHYAVTSACFW